jgi:adenosylcobinamide-phosphate synthase
VLAQKARVTPSLNGGWPMAAMALRLDVRLGKPRVYTLHAAGQGAGRAAVQQALRVARQAAVAPVVLAATALAMRGLWVGVT